MSDISQQATWSSSSPATASITKAGLVTTAAQGTTTIYAAIGTLRGSTDLTVPNATGGPAVINDKTDSRILMLTNSDQSTVTFFGNRDSNGNPTSIYGLRRVARDGSWQSVSLDSTGRPTEVISSDNSQFLLNWTSSTSAIVTAVSPDGTASISTQLGSAAPSSSIKQAAARAVQAYRRDTSAASDSPGAVTAHVSSCSGQVAEDFASVIVIPRSNLGGPIDAQWQGTGTGTYVAQLPTGPDTSDLEALQAAVATALSPICSAYSTIDDYLSGKATGAATNITLGTAFCTAVAAAVVVAGDGLPALEATAIQTACSEGAETALNALGLICTLSNPENTQSLVDFFYGFDQIQVNASLTAGSASQPPQTQTENQQDGGGYAPLPFTYGCPPVDHVNVFPFSLSLDQGMTDQLTATAFDSAGKWLKSSALNFTWNSDNTGIATVAPTGGTIGVNSVATVTAGSTAGTANVTATETSSTKPSAPIPVTVTPIQYSLLVTWTITPLPHGTDHTWSGTDVLMIKNENWTYTGNLTNQGPADPSVVTRVENGSGTASIPSTPNPPAPFTFTVQFGAQWTNTAVSNDNSYGGSEYTPTVTILATPSPNGAYTLSTDTVYAPDTYYGGAQVTVTATGYLK